MACIPAIKNLASYWGVVDPFLLYEQGLLHVLIGCINRYDWKWCDTNPQIIRTCVKRWCMLVCVCKFLSGWWFGTFIFPYIGNNHPNWLIFFRGIETTNKLNLYRRTTNKHRCWPTQIVIWYDETIKQLMIFTCSKTSDYRETDYHEYSPNGHEIGNTYLIMPILPSTINGLVIKRSTCFITSIVQSTSHFEGWLTMKMGIFAQWRWDLTWTRSAVSTGDLLIGSVMNRTTYTTFFNDPNCCRYM